MEENEREDISKENALRIFGVTVVNKAMAMYETDFGKTFFPEDFDEDTCEICSDRFGYLRRAEG